MSEYYPVCLDLANLPVLVVGAGAVGLRKIRTLLRWGARVKVVAPRPLPSVEKLAEAGKIVLRKRPYRVSDLAGVRLVFVATDDSAVNARVAADARERGLMINVADRPDLCDFIIPSIVRRGPFVLAISTGGACPAYAKRLRRELEERFDRSYGDYVALLGRVRREIRSRCKDPKKAEALLGRLLDEDLLGLIRSRGLGAAKKRAGALVESWLAEAGE